MAYYNPHMGVSKNRGTPKSSILIGFSIINHPFWGTTVFGNTHIQIKQIHKLINGATLVCCENVSMHDNEIANRDHQKEDYDNGRFKNLR